MTKPRVRWYLRWRPQVLVFVLTYGAVVSCLLHAATSFIWSWWAPSYRAVPWTMTEADPNPHGPLIHGHLPDEQLVLQEALNVGNRVVLKDLPSVAFEPGRSLPLWHSPEAPDMVILGRSTNHVLVDAMPDRPGWPGTVAWLAAALGLGWLGTKAIRWVAAQASVEAGDLSLRRRPGSLG